MEKTQKRNKVKKVCSVLFSVLTFTLFALCLLLLIFAVTMRAKGNKNATWLFGYGMFQIVSGSMEPEISVGDVVIGKKTDFADLQAGDTIVFSMDGKLVTHRIVSVNTDGTVTTKGLANNMPDKPISENDYVARMQFVVPKLGRVLDFIRSAYGFLLLILLPLGGLILYESVTLTRKLKTYRIEQAREKELEKMRQEIEILKNKLDKK